MLVGDRVTPDDKGDFAPDALCRPGLRACSARRHQGSRRCQGDAGAGDDVYAMTFELTGQVPALGPRPRAHGQSARSPSNRRRSTSRRIQAMAPAPIITADEGNSLTSSACVESMRAPANGCWAWAVGTGGDDDVRGREVHRGAAGLGDIGLVIGEDVALSGKGRADDVAGSC